MLVLIANAGQTSIWLVTRDLCIYANLASHQSVRNLLKSVRPIKIYWIFIRETAENQSKIRETHGFSVRVGISVYGLRTLCVCKRRPSGA